MAKTDATTASAPEITTVASSRLLWLLGPALVAGVAYLDPGNVASTMTAGDDHPDEQVAVAGAGRQVAGDVAGVQVGDAGDEGRAQQPEQAGGRHRRDLRRRGRRSIRFRHAERLAKI